MVNMVFSRNVQGVPDIKAAKKSAACRPFIDLLRHLALKVRNKFKYAVINYLQVGQMDISTIPKNMKRPRKCDEWQPSMSASSHVALFCFSFGTAPKARSAASPGIRAWGLGLRA